MKYVKYKVVNLHRESCYAKGKYQLRYNKDDIVKADIKTHGIMTFKSYDSALEFIWGSTLTGEKTLILEVKPFGRAKKVRNICRSLGFLDRYYKHKLFNLTHPPSNTLCYHAVEVLT